MGDRFRRPLLTVLIAVAFALPAAVYVWIIYHFSVNVIVADQLSSVRVIQESSHHFQWGVLWAQHNNDRLFFPNLIVILIAHTDHFDTRVEEYVSAVMLICATAIFIYCHKRRSPSIPLLFYIPVVLLMFSLSQYFNTLWGFQMCWYLVLLSLAIALLLLDRLALNWVALGGAIAAAVVGSYSSFEGLLIWPVGLVLFYYHRRRAAFLIAWLVAGAMTVALYFHHFRTNVAAPKPDYPVLHPIAAIKFYLVLVGSVARFDVTAGHGTTVEIVFGLLILVLAAAALAAYGLQRDGQRESPIGIALICFGLLFAGAVTQGRTTKGYVTAGASRFTTFDLLILVGIYLSLFGRNRRMSGREGSHGAEDMDTEGSTQLRNATVLTRLAKHPAIRAIVIVVIATQIVASIHAAVHLVPATHTGQEGAVAALENLNGIPDARLPALDLAPFRPAAYVRGELRIAKELHLSLFAGSDRNP